MKRVLLFLGLHFRSAYYKSINIRRRFSFVDFQDDIDHEIKSLTNINESNVCVWIMYPTNCVPKKWSFAQKPRKTTNHKILAFYHGSGSTLKFTTFVQPWHPPKSIPSIHMHKNASSTYAYRTSAQSTKHVDAHSR